MKRILKWIFVTVAACGLFIAAERFAHYKTGGFTIVNITDPHPYDTRWATEAPDSATLEYVRSILAQPFYFLAPGGQTFAFQSQDGQYVLKLTKHKRMRVPLWGQWLPLPSTLEQWRRATAAKKKKIFDCTFKSYLIADTYLKEETGIVFLHLNKSDYLKQSVTIIDKIGIAFKLNIDDFEFILQRKAELFYPHIEKLISEGEIDLVKERIHSMMTYLVGRAKRGIEDHDHCFETNLAFFNNKPFQLDIGSLRLNPAFKAHPMYCVKLREYSEELGEWLRANHPELDSYFEDLINKMLADPNL